MSLLSLPLVLLQSTMHFLHGADLLRFARCCKAIAEASHCKFAWRHSTVYLPRIPCPTFTWKCDALRFDPPLSLTHGDSADEARGADTSQRFLGQQLRWLAKRGLRITELHLLFRYECELDDSALVHSLASRPMRTLTELRIPKLHTYVKGATAICALTQLRTLEVHPYMCADPGVWAAVGNLAALTDLRTTNFRMSKDKPTALEFFAKECPQIRYLSLVSMFARPLGLLSASLADFTSLESLCLESLSFNILIVLEKPVDDVRKLQLAFTRAFAAVCRLVQLTLRHCRSIDYLLPTVAAAPALSLIMLDLDCDLDEDHFGRTPSEAVLLSLLTAAPQLRCEIVVESAKDDPSPAELSYVRELQERYAHASQAKGEFNLRPVCDRFSVRTKHFPPIVFG